MENQKEIWKDIEGCEGLYQVSSFGRVKSFKGKKEKVLANCLTTHGYFTVTLCLDGKQKNKRVHRLVAEIFIGKNDLYINHKDGDKTNNNIENLEYVSQRDNTIHGYKLRKTSSKYTGVYWSKSSSKWQSAIRLNGKRIHIGLFDTELEAYNAYLKALDRNGIKSKYA